MIAQPADDVRAQLDLLAATVEHSYAHNSRVYRDLAESAPLEAIVAFLQWDARQPAFARYLRHWLGRVPAYLSEPLRAHIAEEEDERHSALFTELLNNLLRSCPGKVEVDDGQLQHLNYTFSERCAEERDHAFFVGSFFATEVMSARRCAQILAGIERCGLDAHGLRPDADGPRSNPNYLEIHAVGDVTHGEQVLEHFVRPVLTREPERAAQVWQGLADRLSRSARYLEWYANRILHPAHATSR